jgi:hypothetical protein
LFRWSWPSPPSGQSYVFDDTNLHEVWNDSEEQRVVLFLQVHRDFRTPGRQFSRVFMGALRLSPYLRIPMKNARKFDTKLREAAEKRGLLFPQD